MRPYRDPYVYICLVLTFGHVQLGRRVGGGNGALLEVTGESLAFAVGAARFRHLSRLGLFAVRQLVRADWLRPLQTNRIAPRRLLFLRRHVETQLTTTLRLSFD